MTKDETTFTLPLDWNEWREEWGKWRERHSDSLKPARKFKPGKNFLADEILGVFEVNGRRVELSELTFPNLSERDERGMLIHKDVRAIGLTFDDDETNVVHSFEELERELGL